MDASKPFVCAYLAWEESDLQVGLRRTLRVCGAPAVVLLDPLGGFIEDLSSTRPDEAEAQIRRIAASFPRSETLRRLPDAAGTPWDWIRGRIAELGSDDYERRERATQELGSLQVSLRTAILEAKESADPEVRMRAEQIEKTDGPPSRAGLGDITVDIVVQWLEKGVKPYWIKRQIQKKQATFSLTTDDLKRRRPDGEK